MDIHTARRMEQKRKARFTDAHGFRKSLRDKIADRNNWRWTPKMESSTDVHIDIEYVDSEGSSDIRIDAGLDICTEDWDHQMTFVLYGVEMPDRGIDEYVEDDYFEEWSSLVEAVMDILEGGDSDDEGDD